MIACECDQDGFCPRYQRDMRGRTRDICRGIDVDCGTATAICQQWEREAGRQHMVGPPTPILLRADQAAGDAVAMTAAIYSLHRMYPGRYLTAVATAFPEVFAGNPDVVPVCGGMTPVQMHYPEIHRSNERGIHFMQGWCDFLGAALGVDVPLLTNRPRLYLGKPKPRWQGYWVVCSGGKGDFTTKLWPFYQEVIDILSPLPFVQVGTDQPELCRVYNLVGRTTLRELFDIVRCASGVLCGTSLLMHVAAAMERPAVVIAGGREPVMWNTYPKQHYLHTVGALPCCTAGACWRARTVPLGDGSVFDTSICERPVNATPRSLVRDTAPECMVKIRPDEVAAVIRRYN